MEPPVFFGAAAIVIGFCIFGAGYTETASEAFRTLQTNISRFFGWYYLLSVTSFLLFAIWLLVSRVRRIRIGGPDAKPEFGAISWFTMLFAAGMGIGLVFWAVAEPLMHYQTPLRAEGGTPEALREAMRLTFFHWGFHAWAIYIVLALGISYAHFNRDLPLAPRSVLFPLIGKHIYGPIGHATDILCTVGTLLGVATSLGLGTLQINAGLAQFLPVPQTVTTQILIVLGITAVATVSVVSGIHKGIQRLSRFNLALAFVLLVFVAAVGPLLYILELFVTTLGSYIQNLPRMSLYLDLGPESEWQTTWTLFYWGWWISWSPFVAIFVARISKGRTVGEIVLGALVAPTLATFVWLSVFGGTALHLQTQLGVDLSAVVQEDVAISLHALLKELPLSQVSMSVATLLIIFFFITSSDSGSLVDDIVTSGGDPHPPKSQRVFWAVSEGAVAAVLLAMGGLEAMRNASISLGLLMSVLVVVSMIALARTLTQDPAGRAPRRS